MARFGVVPSNGNSISMQHGEKASALRAAKAVRGPNNALERQTSRSEANDGDPLSFTKTFGAYSVLILLIALMCIGWTTFQMALTAKPNAMANYIMKTEEFDNGTFWLIIEPDFSLVVFSLVALGTVTLGYISMLVQMTVLRGRRFLNSKLHNRSRMIEVPIVRRKRAFLRWRISKSCWRHSHKYRVRACII